MTALLEVGGRELARGRLQGAGNGMPERRLVLARDHDPQAWLILQQLGTQVRKKEELCCPHSVKPVQVLVLTDLSGPTRHDKPKLTKDVQ